MDDCIFCKIGSGIKEDYKVWEDDEFFAVLDINPYIRGHLLVIPKKHSRWVWDMDKDEYSRYMNRVCYLAKVLRKAFGVECVYEGVAGIDVSHSHVHLFPMSEEDEENGFPSKEMDPKPSEEEMREIFGKIRKSL